MYNDEIFYSIIGILIGIGLIVGVIVLIVKNFKSILNFFLSVLKFFGWLTLIGLG